MKKVIGITGGIATGKSVVTSYLRAHGYEVIDADVVVRELQEVGGALYIAIRDTFGEAYFLENGDLDRAKFGALIFSDAEARAKLSAVQDDIIRTELFKRCANSRLELVFMDIPLLFERAYTGFDETWLVYAPQDVQLKRLMKRNDLSESEALLRIKAQMPIDEKRSLATRIIENCDTIEVLENQLASLISEI
ncbi:MAG: dephospho-CoA kinase [Pseudolactococcus laudensis]|uniref:Dephospho-CoA kinase n=1 Tax=Pseudolactococcus laudensis TaxID=1494461 RepID=A0A7V8N0G6_9LACT|nr:dephospho-CoA kinase [Lactococcus laudensis]MBA0016329.1 dephospho-CoA kinase [Lactococcus laudensis]MBQ6145042.1 dephospho-CoA kinase [Lactococcus sp.]MBR2764017.1 dephospho-CoA kinase [Lactococcus sp.]MBW9280865.1 dephospho-CoA kinase [Lactococcus laudensis]